MLQPLTDNTWIVVPVHSNVWAPTSRAFIIIFLPVYFSGVGQSSSTLRVPSPCSCSWVPAWWDCAVVSGPGLVSGSEVTFSPRWEGRRRNSSSSALMATFSGSSQRFRCSRALGIEEWKRGTEGRRERENKRERETGDVTKHMVLQWGSLLVSKMFNFAPYLQGIEMY